MARLTRTKINKKKRGGNVGHFLNDLEDAFTGLFSRTRNKSAKFIEEGSTAISSAVKGTESTVSSGINKTETTLSNLGTNVSNTTKQMMGGKKRKSRKSRKSHKSRKSRKSRKFRKSRKLRKSKKIMSSKKRRMRKSRKH